jgi:hypothetical protein
VVATRNATVPADWVLCKVNIAKVIKDHGVKRSVLYWTESREIERSYEYVYGAGLKNTKVLVTRKTRREFDSGKVEEFGTDIHSVAQPSQYSNP